MICSGCPRPERLSDEAVRLNLLTGAARIIHRDRDGRSHVWHVIKWQNCPRCLILGPSCSLRWKHPGDHWAALDRPGPHDLACYQHLPPIVNGVTWPRESDERDDFNGHLAWVVPCWVTTQAEAERWKP